MDGTFRFMKKPVLVWLAMILLGLTLLPLTAYSASGSVKVYFNGKPLQFEDAEPVIKNGRTLVPFRKIFETLGYEVTWDERNRIAIGEKEGFMIQLPIDGTIAAVGGESVELDVPAQIVKGRTLVPLRFVSENSGYEVSYLKVKEVAMIGISDGTTANPIPLAEMPYFVTGRVVNERGEPVPNVDLYADNQLLYNSNLYGTTDEYGYYAIELPMLATTWHMSATFAADYNGKSYGVNVTPVDDKPFAGNTGAVRNFVLGSVTGELYLYLADYSHPDDPALPPPDPNDVVITLSPVGPLLDGSEGETIVKRGSNFPGGFGIPDVPIGRYEVTAHYMPLGENPVPMDVRIRNRGDYEPSAIFDFESLTDTIHQIEIEAKLR
ncbi:stalk domain-containing protein [Paenibacillus sp. LHD-117]|uniref:stalk domain-containing protein n=1 Tax=Paenibacillus sp. LHD-117 TaxID=3071412 RepID=UPI0027E1FB62|nr:stalk domain-containing protein [Paenibacillus sp. LHD-117]MDQ6418527.1 stalk domain-containing protein [Paenibacillus sp. LHD-117]